MWLPVACCIEQEQSGIFGYLWQSIMASLSAMTVMWNAMSRLRWWRIMGMPLRGPQNAQNHKSGHLDKESVWTLIYSHPWWSIRTQSSEHPASSLVVPWVTLAALLDFYSTRHMLPLQLPGERPTPTCIPADTTSDQDFVLDAWLACFCHVSSFPLCVTCMWIYWLIGEVSSNKPGIVKRYKHVWVTPFGDTPLPS